MAATPIRRPAATAPDHATRPKGRHDGGHPGSRLHLRRHSRDAGLNDRHGTERPPVIASPQPTRYVPRSQAFSPCRGSDPGSPRKPRHRREPCNRACSRNSQMSRAAKPSSVGVAVTARSRPRLRPRHPSSSLHQNARRRNAPHQQPSLAEQMVDGGAHERYGVIAISTPSLSAPSTHRRSVTRPGFVRGVGTM